MCRLVVLGETIAPWRVNISPFETVHIVLVHPALSFVLLMEVDEDEHLAELGVPFRLFISELLSGVHQWQAIQLSHAKLILVNAICLAALLNGLSNFFDQNRSIRPFDVVLIK